MERRGERKLFVVFPELSLLVPVSTLDLDLCRDLIFYSSSGANRSQSPISQYSLWFMH